MSDILRVKEGSDVPRPDSPSPSQEIKKASYSHQQIINQMLALIATCPMDDELKTILRMRIWGKNLQIFAPMSYLDISIDLKCRIKDVERWEADGMHNLEQFLKRMGTGLNVIEKFVRDGDAKKIIQDQRKPRIILP
jgi:hypothetical protein